MASPAALGGVPVPAGWHGWRGIAGLLYARRCKSSPPKVVRATDAGTLLDRIAEAEDPLYWDRVLAARALAQGELGQRIAEQVRHDSPRRGQ